MNARPTTSLLLAALLAICAGCTPGGGGGGGSASSASGASTGASVAPMLRAGAARVDVTPPTGAPLGGFGAPPRRSVDPAMLALNAAALLGVSLPRPGTYNNLFAPSTGRIDGVFVKAIVFERAGGERYAVLGCDAIGVSRKARDEIARRVAPAGIASERLLVAATHTHSGPGGIADKTFWQVVAMDLLDQRLFDAFCDGAARAILEAASRLEPALLAHGVDAEAGVQHNRRGLGVFDPDLSTVGFVRPDGTTIGVMVNLAVHGICLDADNMSFSADLMGFCEREVEACLGGGAVCVYLNGAEGDVSPNDFQLAGAQHMGSAIAQHALAVHAAARQSAQPDAWLASSFESFRFRWAPSIDLARVNTPLAGSGQLNLSVLALSYGNIPLVFDEDMFNRDIPVQAMRLGDACLIAVPGEPLTAVGLDLKAAARGMGFAHPIVVGLSNDHIGYIADPTEYDKGGYEAMMTFFGRETAVELEAAVLRQVDRVKP